MKKLVIFDFDGVLADTEDFCYKIHKDVNGNLTWEKFQGFAEGNFHDGMGKAIREEGYVRPPDFYKKYGQNLSCISIHDVIRESVLHLKDKYKLAVVSSSEGSYISDFLKKERIFDYFEDILGHDIDTSKVVKINMLLEKHKINSLDAVLVTDTLGDVLEATKCGVKSIGVTWGLHEKEVLEKGNPVAIVDDPRELVETVQNVLK